MLMLDFTLSIEIEFLKLSSEILGLQKHFVYMEVDVIYWYNLIACTPIMATFDINLNMSIIKVLCAHISKFLAPMPCPCSNSKIAC